jgi:putative transcriptional regulator
MVAQRDWPDPGPAGGREAGGRLPCPRMSTGSLAGRLLLASTSLQDPNFMRTVVLIGMHSEQGALGLVLNRPSTSTVAEAVPQLGDLVGDGETVYVGGPVQSSAIVVLAEFTDPAAAGILVMGRIGLPGPDVPLERLGEATERRRVYAGHAGWGEGQLDAEIEAGDWIAHDPEPEDIFSERPEELWSTILTRKGGRYALIARMPLDPSLN